MDTKIFEYLLVIEETHNITTAAEQCFVSQPALSKHLRNLEKEFGFPLFEKRKDGVYPTPKGQRCLEIARRMVNAEKETMRKLEDYKNASPKHLMVILEPSLRNIFVRNIWPQFQAQFPDVTVSLIAVDAQTVLYYLSTIHFDVAVFPYVGNFPPEFSSRVINSSEYVVMMPRKHPALADFSKNGVDFHKLQDDTFLLPAAFSFHRRMLEQIFDYYHFTPALTVEMPSLQQVRAEIAQGFGVAVVPIEHAIQLGLPFFSLDPPQMIQFNLVYPKSEPFNQYHAALYAAFVEHQRTFHSQKRNEKE